VEGGLARLSAKAHGKVRVLRAHPVARSVVAPAPPAARCAYAGIVVLPGGLSAAGALGAAGARSHRDRAGRRRCRTGFRWDWLLLSRQQLTAAQLRTALERQRASGEGRIGDWLAAAGFCQRAANHGSGGAAVGVSVLKTSPAAFAAARFVPLPIFCWSLFR